MFTLLFKKYLKTDREMVILSNNLHKIVFFEKIIKKVRYKGSGSEFEKNRIKFLFDLSHFF